jgi:hypothetical protein
MKLRLSANRLFGANIKVHARYARHSDRSFLDRMLQLPMTTALTNNDPSVSAQ